jgi:hypothetical protein
MVPSASCAIFMFSALGHVFGGTEGVGSRFHVLCSLTRFRRCRMRRDPFSCFALPHSFSAVPSSLGPVFMFCAPRINFGGTRVLGPFSCFLLPDSFSSVPRVSGLVFMFCVPGLIFDGTEGVGCRFHVLRSQTHFRRYRGRRVLFS